MTIQRPTSIEYVLNIIIEPIFLSIFVGLLQARELGLEIFHGATIAVDDKVLVNGSRVLTVTAMKEDLASALEVAYKGLAAIYFQGATYRKDVGYQAMRFLRQSAYVNIGTGRSCVLTQCLLFCPGSEVDLREHDWFTRTGCPAERVWQRRCNNALDWKARGGDAHTKFWHHTGHY